MAVEFHDSAAFSFLGTCASPTPAPETLSLDSVIRSRWLERFAPFPSDGKEIVCFEGLPGATARLCPYHRFGSRCFRFTSSASFTNRQSGMANPSAMESATFIVGLRSKRSMREIILGARSAFSAKDSCDNPRALRWLRTAMPKAFANVLERTFSCCQAQKRPLQEQLFLFCRLRKLAQLFYIEKSPTTRAPQSYAFRGDSISRGFGLARLDGAEAICPSPHWRGCGAGESEISGDRILVARGEVFFRRASTSGV